ncbi:adenylate/guanylate cyclase domain-containing protein [Nocardia stercoris]|uniref:Adenylate/guanylate cyclase domain-containing protein n=2 Tax=Nocardia stercoris TaxID=2483361 RepID=A0A3M2LDU0_9NOCA|nr:adenylate/guanylate cyclase domain-containing protein [Nocardia stercoris]
MACNLGGLGLICVGLYVGGLLERLGPNPWHVIALAAIYPVCGALTGVALALRDRRLRFSWLAENRFPTAAEAHRLLNMPVVVSARALALWLPGTIICSAVLLHAMDGGRSTPALPLLLVLGAFEASGLTFLMVDRGLGPVIPAVAEVLGGTMHWSSTVRVRIVITWIVSGAIPLLMLIAVLADPGSDPAVRVHTGIFVALVGLFAGTLATVALALAVAAPLGLLRRAVDRIASGDLDVRVPVGSASEIGRLEHSVNELASNLAEREHMREVFDRHVGPEVAERALSGGEDLTGDVRIVTALFVDVVGSVALSTGLTPREFVAKLNRLLSIVVAATEDNGGLVNKFEGDAALCIFGAPLALRDNATPALRAARRIRDEVLAAGELDIGIGLARGSVFAGDVGTDTRLEFTVIGDAVNEAARLTAEAKRTPRRLLVSAAVIAAATAGERESWRPYRKIRLRGRTEATATWTDLEPRRTRRSDQPAVTVDAG